jgi:hypothetical protein
MKIEIVGLMALGALNIVLGILIIFLSVRLSNLHKLISDVEQRISRLEILTSLSESSERRSAKRQAGGT